MRGEQVKNVVLGTVSAGLGALAQTLGGWDGALQTLVAFMAADYLTGVLVAAVWRRSGKSRSGALSSRAGFQGLCRKGLILLMVWVAQMLDLGMGTAFARTAVCLFLPGTRAFLLENLGLMGVPFPGFLRRALETLREKGDEGDGEA